MGLPAKVEDNAAPPAPPETTGSILRRGATLGEWEQDPRELEPGQLERLKDVRSPLARAYLKAYATHGTISAACKVAGHSSAARVKWRQFDPVYAELEEEVRHDIQTRWDAVFEGTALGGLTEEIFDKNGDFAGRKQRQDSAMLRMVAAGVNPEKYGKDQDAGGIVINIVDTRE